MRRSRIILVLATLGACAAPRAVAQDADGAPPPATQPPAPPISATPDPANAATLYRKAIGKYRELSERTREEMNFALSEFEGDPSRGPSTEVRQMLKRLQPVVANTLNAARRPRCDFGVDIAASPQPWQHLSDLRTLMRLLSYDYLMRIEDQDVRAVADHLATIYRMSGHARSEGTVMASQVAGSVLAYADSRLDIALDHALIGPVEATGLLRELERFSGADPLQMLPALAKEPGLLARRFERRFSGEDAVENFRSMYLQAFSVADEEAAEALEQLSPERLAAMERVVTDASAQVASAFTSGDVDVRDAALERIDAAIQARSDAPLLAMFTSINGSRLRDLMQYVQTTLNDRRELLKSIASGEIDPMSLANAAVWYIRATRQMETIDPVKRAATDAYAAKHDVPADADLTAILARHDMQGVIATLATATNLDRCDWDYAAGHWPGVFRRYHAGLLWCGRLLVADAARLIHAQRYDEATQRLEIAYRLSADLARDGTVAGSLSAHRVFADVDALADAAIDGRLLDQPQIPGLRRAVRGFSRGDPFHYQPAIANMRRRLEYPMRYWVQGLPPDLPEFTEQQRDTADAIRESLDTDRLLSLAVVYDYWEPLYYGALAAHYRRNDMNAALEGLDAIFDVKAAREAGEVAPVITEWAKSKQMELVRTAELPRIAPLAERARQSLSDFRTSLLRYERLAE